MVHNPPLRIAALLAICAGALIAVPAPAADPNGPEVKAAIEKGVAYLAQNKRSGNGDGRHILAALAMAKGGADKNHPVIVSALAAIDKRTEGGTYRPERDHLYTAGLELMLLEAAGDPATNAEKMRPILGYVLAQQQSYGAWYYPTQAARNPGSYFGDTSITQYSVLGLWTAERAGLDLETRVWNRLAEWQVATKQKGGTFAYHPRRDGTGEIKDTMTAAGACNLLLSARYLHGASALDEARAEAEAAERAARDAKNALMKKYAALDRRLDSAAAEKERQAQAGGPVVPLSTILKTADGAIDALARGMQFVDGPHRLYLMYTVERLGALSGRRTIGDVDWYEVGSERLLRTQKPNGSWDGEGQAEVGTAFAVMFLARATAKALGERSLYGGGMLKGGRGLPDDLTQARFTGDEITFDRPTGELADLLSQLEDSRAADVPAAREAVLETVRLGDREALIGQTARLRRLVDDPRPEVRAVVAWALARGGGAEDVAAIFEMLAEDPDAGVVQEAHNALCVLSRLPRGPGIPLAMTPEREAALRRLEERDLPPTYVTNDRLRILPGGPFEGLPPGLEEEERAKAFHDWRAVATAAWSDWRDAVRPYEQRDFTPAPKRVGR
ncbi:HEAT repeat domain-containing protein [Alienimonas sp. DA493]|uniref:HEAT repeat domain-containing protein n=1 Tax=Alienimonas sp. DA493 TaxID=3373605 RepID=UPI003754157E